LALALLLAGCDSGRASDAGETTTAAQQGEESRSDMGLGGVIVGAGVEWQNPAVEVRMGWMDAKEYCACLGGKDGGWRLPVIGELLDFVEGCPTADPDGNCPEGAGPSGGCYWPSGAEGACGAYWSSSERSDDDEYALIVDFDDASQFGVNRYSSFAQVRCIRSTCVDSSDCEEWQDCEASICTPAEDASEDACKTYDAPVGWWKDPVSGLTWENPPGGIGVEWGDANLYCDGLAFAGGGWRLPTIGELRSLIRGCPATETVGTCNVLEGSCTSAECADESCSGCKVGEGPANGDLWPADMLGQAASYWSATKDQSGDEGAWTVVYYSGKVAIEPTTSANRVRCVR